MKERALIVIDVQNEYFDGPLAIHYPSREQSLTHIIEAVKAAQDRLPTVIVQHENPKNAAAFAAGSQGQRLHPALKACSSSSWHWVTKQYASIFAGTTLTDWLRTQDVKVVTLVGYMSNNCVIATAADAERLGFAVEVLSDATGSIHLANEAGAISARQIHETLMVLLQSNFAAVATTKDWLRTIQSGNFLPKSNLVVSALQGNAAHP